MKGADVLATMLIGYGLDTIFGVPGDTNVSFHEALRMREGAITHVMARDERSAGFMADAYGRLTDRPGAIECPSGAGAMYTLSPIAESNASSVPVILLTVDIPRPGEGRGVLAELDCVRLFEPVIKMSVQVKGSEKLPEMIRRAFRVATSGRPWALHLQIPEDMLMAEIDPARVSLHAQDDCKTFPAFPSRPAGGLVEGLSAELERAERPLIVADVDTARRTPRIDQLNALRETLWDNAEAQWANDGGPLRPERAVHCFNGALQASGGPALIYCDAGTPTPHMTQFLKINDPDARLAIPHAFGGLGSALPATEGAWRADPSGRPIGLFGDGSFAMSVGELETLARLKVPAILVLYNNGAFGWIKGLHRLKGHKHCFGVEFTPPRGQAIAEAFDLEAWTARSAAELDAALAEAFACRTGPCLIDVHVESIADRVPPVCSWRAKRGRDPLDLSVDDVAHR